MIAMRGGYGYFRGTFIPESRLGCAITVWHQTDGCLDCPQWLPDNCPKHCLKTAGISFSGWQLMDHLYWWLPNSCLMMPDECPTTATKLVCNRNQIRYRGSKQRSNFGIGIRAEFFFPKPKLFFFKLFQTFLCFPASWGSFKKLIFL